MDECSSPIRMAYKFVFRPRFLTISSKIADTLGLSEVSYIRLVKTRFNELPSG